MDSWPEAAPVVRLLKYSEKELQKSNQAANWIQAAGASTYRLKGRWEVKPTLFPDTPLVMHSEQGNPSLKDAPI